MGFKEERPLDLYLIPHGTLSGEITVLMLFFYKYPFNIKKLIFRNKRLLLNVFQNKKYSFFKLI